ncbi:hypothetical protein E2F43_17385 [Seongchinamella unica]|uniref:Uncharacterized protein n=1 Tax=Seongchinamella unica TaxID=2547392 RepID=A0A4R5LP32_9GAMM|nr:hypothetical protein [Seongchinamella unica]TDG12123.1 hypothetical protein E2F43_17385 [Seongchinamella unica]
MLHLFTRIFVLVAFGLATLDARAEVWPAGLAKPLMGTATPQGEGIILQPNAAGQVLLEFPVEQLSLAANPRVRLRFDGPPPLQVYLLWRNSIDGAPLHQFKYLPRDNPTPIIDMADHANWQGEAQLLQLGFRGPPGQKIHFIDMAIYQPGLADHLRDLWQNWGAFSGWKPADINVYTGTRDFSSGPFPTPVFATLVFAAVAVYLLLARRNASWTGVGLIVFCGWLMLDGLWQVRLWQQVELTWSTFSGASNDEKLARADDAAFSNLARKASEFIGNPQAQVFIATRSDSAGMKTAYYLAPLNVYWHRHGPELPDLDTLAAGNFILLLRPSALRLDVEKNLLIDGRGNPLPIAIRYQDRTGLLLEVMR